MITSQYIEDYLLSVHPNNELWEKIIKYIIKCSLNNLQPLELQHYPEILVYIDSKWQQAIFNILMLRKPLEPLEFRYFDPAGAASTHIIIFSF